jgi:hypothetical protein
MVSERKQKQIEAAGRLVDPEARPHRIRQTHSARPPPERVPLVFPVGLLPTRSLSAVEL